MDSPEPPPVPEHRAARLDRVRTVLDEARNVVLTTHVNADGDGAGSQAALAAWLAARGTAVAIVNPTPFPGMFRYLVEPAELIVDPGDGRAAQILERADLFVVLDTAEPRRLGRVGRAIGDRRVALIDHHPPSESSIDAFGIQDVTACAAGELVYDLLLRYSELWPPPVAEALYVAIVTDTGSFRFANTTPRAHAIAADLIRRGVDPEAVYRRIFANVPLRRLRLLRNALERLRTDDEAPITWIALPYQVIRELEADADDLDGVIEQARSVAGTELAILFRETADGATKISFRSNGDLDVNALARRFGGGGHIKAAGALVGRPMETVQAEALEAARAALRALELRDDDG